MVRPVASVFRFSSEEVAIKAVQTMNGSLFAGMRLGVNFSRFEWPYKVRRKEVYELERKKVASFPLTGQNFKPKGVVAIVANGFSGHGKDRNNFGFAVVMFQNTSCFWPV